MTIQSISVSDLPVQMTLSCNSQSSRVDKPKTTSYIKTMRLHTRSDSLIKTDGHKFSPIVTQTNSRLDMQQVAVAEL